MVILSMLMAAAWLPTMPPKRLGPADTPTIDRYLLWRGDYDRTPKVPEPLDLEPFSTPRPKPTGADRPLRLDNRLGSLRR